MFQWIVIKRVHIASSSRKTKKMEKVAGNKYWNNSQ